MTNFEAILEDLRPHPIRKKLIERKCEKYGIGADDDVSDEKTVIRIVIEILVQMLSLNNVAEGGILISFDKKGVENYIKALCDEIGLDSSEFIKEDTVTYLPDY
jgi:hypothetical protein